MIRCPEPWCAYPMPHEHSAPTATSRPTFADLLSDPTQQLDPEGVVLQAVVGHDDALRAEGWQACIDHIRRVYKGWVDGEDLYWTERRNPFRTSPLPPESDPR